MRSTRYFRCTALRARIDKISDASRLNSLVSFYSSRQYVPLEMKEIVRRCLDRNYNSTLYCHKQLPILLAHAIKCIDNFPAGLSAMKSVAVVRRKYLDCFDLLVSTDQPICEKTELAFHSVLEKIDEDLQNLDVLKTVATGILELKEHLFRHRLALIHLRKTTERWKGVKIPNELGGEQELLTVQEPLDAFNTHYVNYNFLSRQLLQLSASPSSDMVGIVDKELDLVQVVKHAVNDASQICSSAYGDSPDVQFIVPDYTLKSRTLSHMGSTASYIVIELMKNALRATVEANMKRNSMGFVDCSEMPPVTVLISVPPNAEHACICISDEGGGIPRHKMVQVMSYTFTTAEVPALVVKSARDGGPAQAHDENSRQARQSVMAGYGYGLPMSRVYARCFGGDLHLQSMEGYGTKVYYYIKLK